MKKFFVICVFLVGCGSSKYSNEIKQLDSLKNETKKMQNIFMSIDTVKMNSISKSVAENLKSISDYYNPDSIDLRIIGTINYYKSFKKTGAKFNLQRMRVKSEIPYSINQLEALLTDLKNNSLKDEDAQKYISTERQATMKLIETIRFMKTEVDKTIHNYDSISVCFNGLLDSLKSDSLNMQSIRLKKLKNTTKKTK